MAHCDYVDDNANFLDGWHCTIIGGRVDDPGIVGYYCKSVVACQYCPYRGGDDRYRKKEPEPRREVETDDDEKEKKRRRDDGQSSGLSGTSVGVVVGLFAILFVVMFILAKLGAFQTTVNIQLQLPAGVDASRLELRAVSLADETLYETRTKKFKDDGSCSMRIQDGLNDIYIEYDGMSVLLGSVIGDSSNHYAKDDFTYEDLQDYMMRVLLVELQDSQKNALQGLQLSVTNAAGEAQLCLPLREGGYAVVLSDNTVTDTLTFEAEGYAPLNADVDITERVCKMLLTLAAV